MITQMLWAADAGGETPFNVRYSLWTGASADVSAQDLSTVKAKFKPDGTAFYMLGATNSAVYQYTVGTAWDVSTASYASKSASVSSQIATTEGYGLAFSPTGATMYVASATTIYQYTLGTAWDVSTASYASKSKDVSAVETGGIGGIAFNPDGTKLYVAGLAVISEWSLSTAWDISTASHVDSIDPAEHTNRFDIVFTADGLRALVAGQATNMTAAVFQYTLSAAWDLSTMAYDGLYCGLTTQMLNGDGIDLSESAGKLFVVGTQDAVHELTLSGSIQFGRYAYAVIGGRVEQFGLPAAGSVENATLIGQFTVSTQDGSPAALEFSADGSTMYIAGTSTDSIYQYTLSTPWDILTASYASKSKSVSAQDTAPRGLFFKPDGTKLWVAGATNTSVFQYDLGTAWDVSTASYASVSKSVSAQGTTLHDVYFKSDGTIFFTVRNGTTDAIYQYSMSSAWDVSTATYDSKSLAVGTQDGSPTGIWVTGDGTQLVLAGSAGFQLHRYSLSSGWDISTASYASELMGMSGAPTGVRLGPTL